MLKDSRNSKIYQAGVTAFAVIACSIILFFCIQRWSGLMSLIGEIFSSLSAIIWGVVIAYLLWPVVRKIRNFSEAHIFSRINSEHTRRNLSLASGIVLSIFLLLFVIIFLLYMVLPGLASTIITLINNLSSYTETVEGWIETLLSDNPDFADSITAAFDSFTVWLNNWIQTNLLEDLNSVISMFTTGVIGLGRSILNFIIGIIVSICIFVSKDTFSGQFKKIMYALFNPERVNTLLDILRHCNKIFSGFISGKILDSFIIGVICFIMYSIMGMPYVTLISVILGVCNIIPFFGPFLGMVPCAFLILIVNPLQCLIFIVTFLILQQIDGYVIGPAILGDSTGISSFWVIFAILVGGGLFGFPGMILGCPCFAVIYYICKRIIEQKLKSRNLPSDTSDYSAEGAVIDPDTGTLTFIKTDNTTIRSQNRKSRKDSKDKAGIKDQSH